MPHRKLLLGIATKGLPGTWIPRPNFIGVEEIQPSCQFSARKVGQGTDEISVDVIGMILLFHEGTVGKYVADADLAIYDI
jgi:hypothetical protein